MDLDEIIKRIDDYFIFMQRVVISAIIMAVIGVAALAYLTYIYLVDPPL